MSDLNSLTDALREGRAALLNPNLSESERAAVVKVMEGALDLVRIRDTSVLKWASDNGPALYAEQHGGPVVPRREP